MFSYKDAETWCKLLSPDYVQFEVEVLDVTA
jgi:hypothetical protein